MMNREEEEWDYGVCALMGRAEWNKGIFALRPLGFVCGSHTDEPHPTDKQLVLVSRQLLDPSSGSATK